MNEDKMNEDKMNEDKMNEDKMNEDKMNEDKMNEDKMNEDTINEDTINENDYSLTSNIKISFENYELYAFANKIYRGKILSPMASLISPSPPSPPPPPSLPENKELEEENLALAKWLLPNLQENNQQRKNAIIDKKRQLTKCEKILDEKKDEYQQKEEQIKRERNPNIDSTEQNLKMTNVIISILERLRQGRNPLKLNKEFIKTNMEEKLRYLTVEEINDLYNKELDVLKGEKYKIIPQEVNNEILRTHVVSKRLVNVPRMKEYGIKNIFKNNNKEGNHFQPPSMYIELQHMFNDEYNTLKRLLKFKKQNSIDLSTDMNMSTETIMSKFDQIRNHVISENNICYIMDYMNMNNENENEIRNSSSKFHRHHHHHHYHHYHHHHHHHINHRHNDELKRKDHEKSNIFKRPKKNIIESSLSKYRSMKVSKSRFNHHISMKKLSSTKSQLIKKEKNTEKSNYLKYKSKYIVKDTLIDNHKYNRILTPYSSLDYDLYIACNQHKYFNKIKDLIKKRKKEENSLKERRKSKFYIIQANKSLIKNSRSSKSQSASKVNSADDSSKSFIDENSNIYTSVVYNPEELKKIILKNINKKNINLACDLFNNISTNTFNDQSLTNNLKENDKNKNVNSENSSFNIDTNDTITRIQDTPESTTSRTSSSNSNINNMKKRKEDNTSVDEVKISNENRDSNINSNINDDINNSCTNNNINNSITNNDIDVNNSNITITDNIEINNKTSDESSDSTEYNMNIKDTKLETKEVKLSKHCKQKIKKSIGFNDSLKTDMGSNEQLNADNKNKTKSKTYSKTKKSSNNINENIKIKGKSMSDIKAEDHSKHKGSHKSRKTKNASSGRIHSGESGSDEKSESIHDKHDSHTKKTSESDNYSSEKENSVVENQFDSKSSKSVSTPESVSKIPKSGRKHKILYKGLDIEDSEVVNNILTNRLPENTDDIEYICVNRVDYQYKSRKSKSTKKSEITEKSPKSDDSNHHAVYVYVGMDRNVNFYDYDELLGNIEMVLPKDKFYQEISIFEDTDKFKEAMNNELYKRYKIRPHGDENVNVDVLNDTVNCAFSIMGFNRERRKLVEDEKTVWHKQINEATELYDKLIELGVDVDKRIIMNALVSPKDVLHLNKNNELFKKNIRRNNDSDNNSSPSSSSTSSNASTSNENKDASSKNSKHSIHIQFKGRGRLYRKWNSVRAKVETYNELIYNSRLRNLMKQFIKKRRECEIEIRNNNILELPFISSFPRRYKSEPDETDVYEINYFYSDNYINPYHNYRCLFSDDIGIFYS